MGGRALADGGLAMRGLILDRDGVVNVDTGYLHKVEECRFVDGIFDMARAFAARGFRIIVATNQSGIGRGYFGDAEFHRLMDWMKDEFRRHGAAIDAVYHCPDHPTEGVGLYRRENPWRKPGPGMILQAAADLGLDLSRSWCVGDKPSDVAAGRAAGVGTLVLLDADAPAPRREADVWVVSRLPQVVDLLRAGEPG
jgi:D-glycero-D-manno-heptose 1,7-bisphosphate phosphatase